jgi:predicted alpha-1,2-mannosidase
LIDEWKGFCPMNKQIRRLLAAIPLVFALALLTSCSPSPENLTQFVDPLIGTGGHGHVFIGANVPFGMVQLGPNEFSEGWDWCSGYHYSDSVIIGFAHTHLSGAGSADMGDIALMPAVGAVSLTRGTPSDPVSGLGSKFSHQNEIARAGYYRVHLDRFGIDVELTATARVGFHKYTFPASSDAKVIIDLEHGLDDTATETFVVQEDDSTVSGYRTSTGWARNHTMYFTASFSRPMNGFSRSEARLPGKNDTIVLPDAYGVAHFSTTGREAVLVKVALSPVSIENAKMNLRAELPGWDFDKTRIHADQEWNRELNRIRISSPDEHVLRTFYTAFYHTMVAPSVYCDVNGDYYGTDRKVHTHNDFVNYSTFSLWDTYRAAHPLMNLVHPERVPDIANTFLHIFKEQGKLPVWHMLSNETNAMVGNPGAVVLADIVLKGFPIDDQAAFEAMKTSAMLDERGLKWMKQYGYIPYEKINSSVARALEYGLADWSIAQVAKKLGKEEDYRYFVKRSRAYRYYFDPETRFLRPKDSLGRFRTPFDPFSLQDYREGNAWQYTWLVPHDVNGLISLFGSEEAFTSKLDSLFIVKGEVKNALDVTGLIGQYAHGNEPSHHIIYLYNYVGQPWKTAVKAREVLTTLYNDQPAGLSGNEDVGQMSAWYILSALGMYPVAPAGGDFVFGSPLVNRAIVKLANHKTLKIIARNNGPSNIYIQAVRLNGKEYPKSWIRYEDIVAGGTLEFLMGAKPSATYGTAKADRPSR